MEKTAEELAKKQREISIAEFFEKNRHLLGFDNPRRALLTAVKEAVDNSLDACEEARILPEMSVELLQLAETRFRISVEDNGPGIIPKQIPNIFAKLLYGSKFHKLAQSRGQQGIGISATVLYGQLTTGKPASIISKTGAGKKATQMKLKINTQTNSPEIVEEREVDWDGKDHGTRIEVELEGSYMKGRQSVDEYLKQTAIINPYATIVYTNPEANQVIFARGTEQLPQQAKEIKPHPYGVELGRLMKMLELTKTITLQQFLTEEFVRIGPGTAKEICANAALLPNTKAGQMSREQVEKLYVGIQKTKIMAPPTDCLSPISQELLEKSLKKELITVLRFANKVPLLYQPGACAFTKAVLSTNWKPYGLKQSNGSLPVGPVTILLHIASVWVPFTSESKEALAHYPEIIKEIKLALQDVGRKMQS